MNTTTNLNSRVLRLALTIQDFRYTVEYIKGETNIADLFSRPSELRASINQIRVQQFSSEDKKSILREYHLASGHGSVNTMNFLLKEHYNWNNITRDIEDFVKTCPTCLKAGEELVNTKNRPIESEYPNEIWEIDLIGRIPIHLNQKDNRYIVVAIDHYTKWTEARIIQKKTSEEIVRVIQDLIIDKHGTPTKVISDCGLEFTNDQVKKFAASFGIEWFLASPRHHQTVGAVERCNQTIFTKLRKLSEFGVLPWEPLLDKAVYAYNISYHRALGTSPYILKTGQTPDFSIDKKFNIEVKKKNLVKLLQDRNLRWEKYSKQIEKGESS